jgi:predicted ribosome quality control (RQC) complex YloA/Tae2 family protein
MRKVTKYIESIKGYIEFQVGQNAKENFELIDISNPNDLWFHINQQASCHVVATLPQDNIIDKRILKKIAIQGAVICKHYSRHKSESAISVMYTPIKNVKKGGNMGSVFVDEYTPLNI